MFSLVTLAPDAVVPTHSHPHEQMGMLCRDDGVHDRRETRGLSGSEIYVVPGGVPHAAKAGPGGAVALDAFSPPGRSTAKYVKAPRSAPSAPSSRRLLPGLRLRLRGDPTWLIARGTP